MHEKIVSVGIVVPRSEVEKVSKFILDSRSFELLDVREALGVDLETEPHNPYDEPLSLVEELYSAVGKVPRPKPEKVELPLVLDEDELRNFTRRIKGEIEDIEREKERLTSEIEKLDEWIAFLEVFRGLELGVEDLRDMKYVDMEVGWVHEENLGRLLASLRNAPALVLKRRRRGSRICVVIFHPRDYDPENVLRSVSFNRLEIPDFTGNVEDVLFELKDRKKALEIKLEELELRKREIFYANRHKIYEYHDELYVLKNVHDLMKLIGETEEFAFVVGWTTRWGLEELGKLEDILVFENVKLRAEKPTLLRNPRFFKPFESIVKMYGIPRSDEIDPTPFVASLFLFFYGFMFGDLGHGGVIALLSYLLFRKTRADLWYIMTLAGISSSIFGVLYGSFFGFEMLPALVGRPMEEIEDFLIFSIFVGVVIIVLGMILNVVNRISRRELKELVFDPNGFAGLGFYLVAVSEIIGYLMNGTPPLPFPLFYTLLLTFLALFFVEPILFGEGNVGERMILAFFETFDRLIAFFSNTLSFIRLGAFAMNHAGLFLAFYTMAKMSESKFGSFMSLLFGNLLLIFLEGLVVFIQSLRLEFYEFFSKFYSGDGKEFKPVGYKGGVSK